MNKTKIPSSNEKLDFRKKDAAYKTLNSAENAKRERDNNEAGQSSARPAAVGYSPRDIEIPDDISFDDFPYEEHQPLKKKSKLKDFVINNPKGTDEFPDDDSLFDNLGVDEETNLERAKSDLSKFIVDDPEDTKIPDGITFDECSLDFTLKNEANSTPTVIHDSKDTEIPEDIDFDDNDFDFEQKNDKKTTILTNNSKNEENDKNKTNLLKNKSTDFEIPDDIDFDDFDFDEKKKTILIPKNLINLAHEVKKPSLKITEPASPSTSPDPKTSPQQLLSKLSLKSKDSGIETELTEQDYADLFSDWSQEKKYNLDLDDFHRVRVLKVEETRSSTRLTVSDPETQSTTIVTCSESWSRLKVSPGDFVTIKASKSPNKSSWTINNSHGFCVTQPDTLITSTSVVNSFFCMRQGVLQTKLTGMNQLPNLAASDSALTLGTIIHELLQSALTESIFELKDLTARFDEIIKNPSTILMLYCSELKEKDIKSLAEEYIQSIHKFMYRYVKNEKLEDESKADDDNFAGHIVEIKDIEESVYLPSLGLKGKIDATVSVKVNNTTKIMPLEIKTGKSSFSQSHKGQLSSYCLMLNNLGTKVDAGLLLYIKDNLIQEFRANRQEEKELILLRNTVAYYLSKLPGKDGIKNMELPDPIYHTTACSRCPYNSVCCVYADRINAQLSEHHPLKKLSETLLQNVTENHVDYVLTWIAMLELEEGVTRDIASSRRIWRTTPLNREKTGQCISNLTITSVKNGVVHHFARSKSQIEFPVVDFRDVFSQYDVVSIGTDTRIHLSSGRIIKISDKEMVIVLDKDLTKWNNTGIFHADFYPYINRTTRLLGAVATLFTDNPITNKLRRIIIDKQPATFSSHLPDNFYTNEIEEICCRLNLLQDNAVKSAVQADDYVLIKTLPGTGRVYLITALVEILVLMGKTVLITANSHNAVNNILLKLLEKGIDFLRIGRTSRIHPLLLEKCDDKFITTCTSSEMLERRLEEVKVVGVTCYSAGSGLLSRKIFDYCIVDESNQMLQPVILKPIFNAEKVVLVGDPEQLTPRVRSDKARNLGMSEDIFSRLDSPNNTRVLALQYRMNLPVMNLVNQLSYQGGLRAADETVAGAVYKLEDKSVVEQSEGWIKRILSNELARGVVLVDTGAVPREIPENKKGPGVGEAAIVKKLVETLGEGGVELKDVGIISPFRRQVKLLRRVVGKCEVEINCVEEFQGKNKSIILLSFGGESEDDDGVLEDQGRLNAALSRAKHKIVVIGDVGSLEGFGPVKKMIDCLALTESVLKLKDGIDDFSWEKLLAGLDKQFN